MTTKTWRPPTRQIRRGVPAGRYANPPARRPPAEKADEGSAGDFRARHLIRWYNHGADGQILWGSPGDFDACVAVATEHAGDQMTPEEIKGFCANRHHDALGIWPATHAAQERHKAASADLDPDEAIAALLAAMDRIRPMQLTRSWDSAKHPRIPSGFPGGGRFLSLVDHLRDKLDAHLKGDRQGDPFEGFDREQLRRVARKRGIFLNRGESRDDIVRKLLEHLGNQRPVTTLKKLPDGVNPKDDIPAAGHRLDPAAKARVERAMRTAYEFEDGPTGLRTRVERFDISPGSDLARIYFSVVGRDGRSRGIGERAWIVDENRRLIVAHSELILDNNIQGGGFAARLNAQAEEIYRDAGADEIQLHANIDVGGYAWAAQGYDFRNESDMVNVGRRLTTYFSRHPVDSRSRRELEALLARATSADFKRGTHPTPYEYAMAGRHAATVERRPDGREILVWPGKQAMLGSDWRGRKGLGPIAVAKRATPTQASADSLLSRVARCGLEYADKVADKVRSHPGDVNADVGGPSAYPSNHHLFSAPPDLARVWLEVADVLLAATVR